MSSELELEVEVKALIRYADDLKKANQDLKLNLDRIAARNSKLIEQRNKLIEQRNKLIEQRNKIIEQRNKAIVQRDKAREDRSKLSVQLDEALQCNNEYLNFKSNS